MIFIFFDIKDTAWKYEGQLLGDGRYRKTVYYHLLISLLILL